ncbi:MAG: hypothetical protein U9P36_06555 [Thermodesulfobacteriota bacterium]|nr:hypothetical protein [Thermodesulfobacteriota bacterium]
MKDIFEAKMKKIIFTLFAVLLTTSIAIAAWQDTFLKDFAENGTAAVAKALAEEASPDEIIAFASAAGVQAETLVTAMCDAGLSPQDLQGFLPKLGMSTNALMSFCGGQGNISNVNKFPGASTQNTNSLSVSTGTNYAGDGKPLGSDGGATAPLPASPNNFN